MSQQASLVLDTARKLLDLVPRDKLSYPVSVRYLFVVCGSADLLNFGPNGEYELWIHTIHMDDKLGRVGITYYEDEECHDVPIWSKSWEPLFNDVCVDTGLAASLKQIDILLSKVDYKLILEAMKSSANRILNGLSLRVTEIDAELTTLDSQKKTMLEVIPSFESFINGVL